MTLMLAPATILTALAYAIAKNAGSGGPVRGVDLFAQLFGGAAGNAFNGDSAGLLHAFRAIARPGSSQDLERVAARSALHASLFCLMKALGESLEPASGTLAEWRQCIEARLPQDLRDLPLPPEGFLAYVRRRQLLHAKKGCEAQLEQIEIHFTPAAIEPNEMLVTIKEGYATLRATEALEEIEAKRGRLPDYARQIFLDQWFGYLCGSFHYEIEQHQPVANILVNISVAQMNEKIDQGFRETHDLILDAVHPVPTLLEPFATVPPLPHSYIERPEISGPLREKLLSASGTVALTAVEGMGGVGKTIVALGLCHDTQVRKAFPDGIVWLTIGKESSIPLEERVRQVAQALNRDSRVYSEATYRSLLQDKTVLVVLDNVSKLDDVEPFRLDTGRSRLLYTSRDKGIAGPLGAESQEVGVLDDAQARRFLCRWSGRDYIPLPEPYASGILDECKGLALGLAMIGAALKGKPDSEWARLLVDLKDARLKDVGVRPGGYAYETLHASIAVSVNALDPFVKVCYLRLAVLLEDMPASEVMLRALWGGQEHDAHRTARLFVDRSLARWDAEGNIRLHDFQLDYVRGEHNNYEALALEHSALMLSSHVLRPHSEQFASQMTGRLLAHSAQPGIAAFLKHLDACAPRPRLRPLRAALTAAGNSAERVLEGHTDEVTAVALTADGKRAVSGSDDKTLWVWDLEGGQPPRVLEGHTAAIRAVALTADGKRAVSGSDDNTLRVWDLERNQPPRVLEGHRAGISAVALTADGKRAVSGSFDQTLRVWDLEGNQPPRVLEGHTGWVQSVALTADGKRAVSGSFDQTLRVWDLEGNQPPRVLEGHTGWVLALALTADGKRVVSGSDDDTLRVWDLEDNQPPRVLEGHTAGIRAVALTADGTRAVSGSDDNTLRVWDLDGNHPPRVLEGHKDWIWAVALTDDGKRAVSCSRDKTLRVWDLDGNQLSRLLKGNTGWVSAVALTDDGKRAVSGSRDHTLRVWDIEGNQPPRVLEGHTDWVLAVALTADGTRAVSGSADQMLRVWDLEGDQPPRVLEGHTDWVSAVALTADGARAVSASFDQTLRVWDLEGNQPPRVLEGHTAGISAVALTADGKFAVSGSDDKTLRIWDLEGNQPPRVLEGHTDWVRAVAVTADGKFAVSGSGDNTLRIWDLEGNQPPRLLEGNTGWVQSVALTADGTRAVSGSRDQTLRVWDLDGNQPPCVLEGHTGWVWAVALTADGTRAVSGSDDNTLRVWDLDRGRCLMAFTCDFPVYTCAWASGHIVAGDESGQVHILAWEE